MFIKKIVYFMFIIIAVFTINDLARSIYDLWRKSDLITRSTNELALEKKRNNELKNQLKNVDKPQFIEEEVRNKLFMVRQGEGIIVIAPSEYLKPKSPKITQKDIRPNWQKWWEIFF